MTLGLAGTKDCKVPTTTAKAKRQRIVLETLMMNSRRARVLVFQTLLLDDLFQFRHLLEVFLLFLFVFLGLRGPGRRVGWHWNGHRGGSS
jgi:hypothetical protein